MIIGRDFEEITVKGHLTEPKAKVVDVVTEMGIEKRTVLNLAVCANRTIHRPDGTVSDVPYFYEISVWGSQAEKLIESNKFVKGQEVFVKGVPNYEIYDRRLKDGTTEKRVRVRIDSMPGRRLEIYIGAKPDSDSIIDEEIS